MKLEVNSEIATAMPIAPHKYVVGQILSLFQRDATFTPRAWDTTLATLETLCDVLLGSIIPEDEDDKERQGFDWVLGRLIETREQESNRPPTVLDILDETIKNLKIRPLFCNEGTDGPPR